MDANRAYGMGRQAAQRGGEITEPAFERIHAPRYAEMLAKNFWQGVRDLQAEDRINKED